jgi:hypothetical protein
VQRVGLEPADALRDQGGDVTVAAVFAEQVGRVPEPGDRFVGDRQRSQSRVQGASLDRGARGRLDGQVGRAGDARGIGLVGQDPPHGSCAAPLAGGEDRFGSGDVPDMRNVPGDLAVGEVVEDRVHHLGRDPPQRGGTPGEVGVPVVPVPECHDLGGRLRGGVRDEGDRLGEPEQSASQVP